MLPWIRVSVLTFASSIKYEDHMMENVNAGDVTIKTIREDSHRSDSLQIKFTRKKLLLIYHLLINCY